MTAKSLLWMITPCNGLYKSLLTRVQNHRQDFCQQSASISLNLAETSEHELSFQLIPMKSCSSQVAGSWSNAKLHPCLFFALTLLACVLTFFFFSRLFILTANSAVQSHTIFFGSDQKKNWSDLGGDTYWMWVAIKDCREKPVDLPNLKHSLTARAHRINRIVLWNFQSFDFEPFVRSADQHWRTAHHKYVCTQWTAKEICSCTWFWGGHYGLWTQHTNTRSSLLM